MSRYFDADDFFRTFEELDIEPYNNFPTADVVDRNECSKCVLHPFKQLREQLETDVVEVVHGKWNYKGLDFNIDSLYQCSACSHYHWAKSNYCPNCGAWMDERR